MVEIAEARVYKNKMINGVLIQLLPRNEYTKRRKLSRKWENLCMRFCDFVCVREQKKTW